MKNSILVTMIVVAAGCAPNWIGLRDTSETQSGVRVWIQDRDGDDFRFAVSNGGNRPVSVLVGSIRIMSPRATASREEANPWMGMPGFIQALAQDDMVQIPPGHSDTVFANFDVGRAKIKKGDLIQIDLSKAVLQDGRPVSVPPLEFRAD